MPTYFSLTVRGFELTWDAIGVYLKAGKVERFWSSLPNAKA